MLTVARLATYCALRREESRGVHYRTDRPATSTQRVHSCLRPVLEDERVARAELRHEPVGEGVPVA